ncbi:TadE/TadG family type IV pilus assembly protein [Streptomyces alkaliterrae]|uniref:Pilus assembly protein n=1 Tax=Streptomyces alkaliterrae TaxID=2213162 RepID=A0A7W3ZQQ6_9ACTN|nr:TadE/TadG family type IV pilus assembly protein [Streptomyces alkaliterrae]MBB1256812.1 pilus assembly protein [Streptomyces alkaliterrae]
MRSGPADHRSARQAPTDRDSGQATVEFLGMVPLILLLLVLCWQFVLVGYTFVLAGDAADRAARANAVGESCQAAAARDMPGSWASGASVSCPGHDYGEVAAATVRLKVPVLFPGSVNLPLTISSRAAAPSEAAE